MQFRCSEEMPRAEPAAAALPASSAAANGINMRRPSPAFIYSEPVAGNFIKSNIIKSFPAASSSHSPRRRRDTCQCQSNRNNTQMICSFGLMKSSCLFALPPLHHVIAAAAGKAAVAWGIRGDHGYMKGWLLCLSLPSHSYS